MSRLTPDELLHLRALSYRFPTVDSALAESAHLRAVLALPKGTVHVVSDVHGEFKKLEHILRNASGSLRPLVETLFAERLAEPERVELLSLIYYPREKYLEVLPTLPDADARTRFVRTALLREFEVLRALAARYSLRHIDRVIAPALAPIFRELLFATALGRSPAYLDGLLEPYFRNDQALELLRGVSRAIRALSVFELVVAGDLGDRGPRLDAVVEALRNQHSLAITFGNHDAEWMGACLGQEALIATVVRVSLRYGRVAQLEEGYGIPVEPVELLARSAYGDDPAERFTPKGEDIREPLLLARMQKAMAVLQFKLEGQVTRRNPHFELEHRNLLHRIDPAQGTVTVDGKVHKLLDARFPTIDWRDPYALTPAEAECIARLKRSFFESSRLWDDMRFVARAGSMYLLRDQHVIFHGCVPVEADGSFQSFAVDGVPYAGRALFDALDDVVQRAFRLREERDADLLYYLWAGARSPLFGKDRMATFEGYFIADPATHKETKNPYFKLIHDREFCRRVAREMGADPDRALIVNGHVPVKLESGESPLKNSGMAVTIDGAFSEAYGDRGYTLVLDADRTYLAQHYHFESVRDAITRGADIIPTVTDLRRFDPPRTVADTPRGDDIRREIAALERLIEAYQSNLLAEVPR